MLTDFYNISSCSSQDGNLSFSFTFNALHPIFEGHFPNQPVVPGVCVLQIIREQLNLELHTSLEIITIAQAKFLQPLVPDDIPVTAKVTFSEIEIGYKINATLTKNENITTKIQATLCA